MNKDLRQQNSSTFPGPGVQLVPVCLWVQGSAVKGLSELGLPARDTPRF